MKVAVRVIGIFICILLVSTFLIEPLAGQKAVASPANQPPAPENLDEILVSSLKAPEWTRATREWTAAEMAAAKPYPMPELDGAYEMLVPSGDAVQPQAGTALTTFPAALPEGEVGFVNDLEILGNFGGSAPMGYTYPGPFTRYTLYNKYNKEFPNKAIGKLFFVQNGYTYVCSAAVIGPSAIWTAGHCVHDGSGSSSGWSQFTMFVPAYDSGKKPLWSWFGAELWTHTQWYTYGNLGYDYGGIVLGKTKRKFIYVKTGWLGFAYRPNANGYYAQHHWFGIGYPAASPFDGNKQVVCASSYSYSDTAFSPNPVGVGCDQTGGTSGGPWILAYGSGYYVNGNMSYRYVNPSHPSEMFSPYFNDSAYGLWYELFY
jgi:V8-like Glu-specific endopeptidase